MAINADTRPPVVSAALLILIGIVLLGGGAYLVSLGGSLYYVLAGAAVFLAGALYWRGNRWGERIYALMLIGTLIWACLESGANPWALVARLFAPAVLGLWLAMPWVRSGLRDVTEPAAWRSEVAIVAVVILGVIAFRFVQFTDAADEAVASSAPETAAAATPAPADSDWPNYGNGLDGQRFAPLTQVNTQNVANLQVAWIHHSGDIAKRNLAEATPIKIGDTLYTCGPRSTVYAIDAKTGAERWRNDPKVDTTNYKFVTCRGVSFYHQPDATGACADRVIATAPGGLLRALDAATGTPCEDFGEHGVVNLFTDLGKVDPGDYSPTSAPTVVSGIVVLGSMVYDSRDADIASGVIRAYDAKTGALRWAWDMGAPDRIGAPAAGETYTRSTPNAWPSFAADEALGLVYVPTGNPSPDFYGIHRRPFDEKYGSSLVALNVTDGRPRWSYQTTHHDLWDYDLPAQPILISLPGADGDTPAVVQATKRGDIFVLDRRDGHLIVPAPEREVPGGAMEGEAQSKTQPVSEMSLIPKPLVEADMWGATPIDQMLCRIDFKRAHYEGFFTPPGLRYTIQYPGSMGTIDWGGVSVNDDDKIVVANTTEFPWYGQQVPREQVPGADNTDWPQRNTPNVLRSGPFLGPLHMPCAQPPWGKLAAIDLKTNKVLWRHVLGTAEDLGPFETHLPLPLMMGPPSLGGSITTRGGLIFIAATLDPYFRAFDIHTGKKLWEVHLPAGAQAMPMTYMAGGKQYIVLTAGGHTGVGTKPGDDTIAYALPDAH